MTDMEIKNNPIGLISKIINNSSAYTDNLEILAKAIDSYLSLDLDDVTCIELIKKSTKLSDKKVIGIILLRLYNTNGNLIDENNELKRELIKLLDDVFTSIYRKINLDKKIQSYKKLPKLIDYIEQAEKSFNNVNITDLSGFSQFKQQYLSTVNGKYSDIITPFLEKNFMNEVKKIFKLVENYKDKSNLNTYNELVGEINKKITDLEKIDSEYNNIFLLDPFTEIMSLVKKDFDKNPDSQPASIMISSTGKKYPLEKNNKFNLVIQLKNIKSGIAYKTKIKILDKSKTITLEKLTDLIGEVNGNEVINIEIQTSINASSKSFFVRVEVAWEDYLGKSFSKIKRLSFNSQRLDINWESLEARDAYSIRAVENEERLIGRKDILNDLHKGLSGDLNSYYIHGQKRVGKTSIVKTLKSKLKLKMNNDFVVTYIVNTGTSVEKAIQNLGKKICKEVKRQYKKELKDIVIPVFTDNIDPLEDFLDDVNDELENEKKFVFILDEFDEMSSGLYESNDVTNAFFLAIRNFASHDRLKCSFILVGGEKISFLMSIHGKHLNFFNEHRVDYFDKEHLTQFKELVQKPVSDYIDITDEAIDKVYMETAGNPYFTNLICKEMLSTAIEKKDSHITDKDMMDAILRLIYKSEKHIFIHFWEDGIREFRTESIAEETSYKRRSVLLALSSLLKMKKILKKQYILDKLVDEFNSNEIKRILEEFSDRKILIENNEVYSFRINFFQRWLIESGSEKIIMTCTHEQQIQKRAKMEKEAKITSQEIKNFIDEKNIIYNGIPLTTDDIRSWIEQFGDNLKQRLVFEILNNITYYRDSNIKDKMKTLYEQIRKMKIIPTKGKKMTHILVSYLDQVGKSSAEYAKYFVDENSIHSYNIVEKNRILEKLNKNGEIKILVFIDDFIGTGNSIIEYIANLKEEFPDIFKKEIDIYIGIVTGFQEAKEKIEQEFDRLKIKNINIILSEPLNERDKCFSESSKIFTNSDKRREAKDLCEVMGSKLVSKNPLGYGDCQATVIFPETCPNNCLPVFWEEKNKFKPLFPRKK